MAEFSVTVQSWLLSGSNDAPTVSGFLFGTLSALAAGMIVNAIRWHTVDRIHYLTGVPRRSHNNPRLADQMPSFEHLVRVQFRYYECYANMFVSLAFLAACYRANHSVSSEVWLAFVVVELILWSASRRTLAVYHTRLLLISPGCQESKTIDRKTKKCYTPESPSRRKIVSVFVPAMRNRALRQYYRNR